MMHPISATSWSYLEYVELTSMPRDLASDMAWSVPGTCNIALFCLFRRTCPTDTVTESIFWKPVPRLRNFESAELPKNETRLGSTKLTCSVS